jgi:hypothetical protein
VTATLAGELRVGSLREGVAFEGRTARSISGVSAPGVPLNAGARETASSLGEPGAAFSAAMVASPVVAASPSVPEVCPAALDALTVCGTMLFCEMPLNVDAGWVSVVIGDDREPARAFRISGAELAAKNPAGTGESDASFVCGVELACAASNVSDTGSGGVDPGNSAESAVDTTLLTAADALCPAEFFVLETPLATTFAVVSVALVAEAEEVSFESSLPVAAGDESSEAHTAAKLVAPFAPDAAF